MFGVRQKACGRLPKHMREGTLVRWDKRLLLAIKENAMFGANPTPPITPRTSSAQWSMVGMFFISKDWETGQNWRNDGWCWIQLNSWGKPFSVFQRFETDGGSPSSRTMTLRILLKQLLSGLRGNISMSWIGLVKAQTSIQLWICGMT